MVWQLWNYFTLDPLKLPFYLFILLTNIRLASYIKDFHEKAIVWKNCVKMIWKYFYLNHVEFCIQTVKNYLSFYKNSSNQTFTFIRSKLVYFKKHLTYQE